MWLDNQVEMSALSVIYKCTLKLTAGWPCHELGENKNNRKSNRYDLHYLQALKAHHKQMISSSNNNN